MKTKIYIFCNNCAGEGWHDMIALAEDGECLAGHMSSHHGFGQMDMGALEGKDWTRKNVEVYAVKYPEGYELVWIDDIAAPEHADVLAALNAASKARETV